MIRNTFLTTTLLGVAASLAGAACTPKGSSALSGSTGVSNVSTSSDSGLVAATYFAGYHADDGYPVSSIQWDKYTEIKYAFA